MTDKSERNWLIRTRSMQILGPVSLAKVLELIEKGSLRDEDEVTSGNGYWFCVRETELVERYLVSKAAQGFNPIAEAKTVLSNGAQEAAPPGPSPKVERRVAEEEEVTPLSEEDLEYPDIAQLSSNVEEEVIPEIVIAEEEFEDDDEPERDDVTMVASNLELPVEKPVVAPPQQPPPPVVEEEVEETFEEEPEVVVAPVKKVAKKTKPAAKVTIARKSDRYLFLLLALVISLVIGVIYYYRTILNKPLPGFETSWIMNSAHAQNAILTSTSKKKTQIASLQ